jgi:ribosomal-protein-alanine N-acetyltransferase
MDVPFQVRRATEPDLRDVAEIEHSSFSDAWPRASFLPLLGEFAWAAESAGRVVGYLFGRVAADEAEVLNIAVHPDYRRRGIARALLTAALDGFGSGGARNAYLEVRAANEEAQAFYRNMGFREQGRRRRYYDDPLDDAVVMARPITTRKRLEKKGP